MEKISVGQCEIQDYDSHSMINVLERHMDGYIVSFGKAVMKPNGRVPKEGCGVHEFDEYSYIIKGSLVTGNEEGEMTEKLTEGDFTFIKQGEKHWSINLEDEDCELVWFMVKKEE